jgi:hypothetical protein
MSSQFDLFYEKKFIFINKYKVFEFKTMEIGVMYDDPLENYLLV